MFENIKELSIQFETIADYDVYLVSVYVNLRKMGFSDYSGFIDEANSTLLELKEEKGWDIVKMYDLKDLLDMYKTAVRLGLIDGEV